MRESTKEIIVGSLLGDGWLTALSPKTGTSRYVVKYQGSSKSYLLWLKRQVLELNPAPLKVVSKYSQYYFYTKARTDIGEMRKLFYPKEGRKVVPSNIGKLLRSPQSLALWYQDDGTLDQRSGYHWNAMFSTYCFSYSECVLLANVVWKNFRIHMSVCRCRMRGKMYYRLYVRSESMPHFIKIVRPFIHPTFRYKIVGKTGQQ